jgi:polysaccharide deacetylase 2 family uncharacterized protein YibQ
VSRSRPHLFGWGWALSFLWSVGFGALLFATTVLPRPGAAPLEASPALRSNWAADFPVRIERVTAALAQLPMALPTPVEEPQGSGPLRWMHRLYEVTLPAPANRAATERLLEPVRSAAPGVALDIAEGAGGARVQIGIDGLLTHTLALRWLDRRPRAAIIIDDLGNDLLTARELAGIDAPLTFAVMPFRPFSQQVAELAALFGREVLLHLPMESEDGEDFGAQNVLRVSSDRTAIVTALDESLAAVPHCVGVNNHMGSRFTGDRERMRWTLERLKEDSLFFIDSRTSPHSVACEVAAAIALPCATRSLFLDETDDEAAVAAQLEALLHLARTRGDVIAIGHPRPDTVAALRAALPGFAPAGVDVVPASVIAADQSLSRR